MSAIMRNFVTQFRRNARDGWNGDAHAMRAQQLPHKCRTRVAQKQQPKTKPDPSLKTVAS
jgi:hypothetical protein